MQLINTINFKDRSFLIPDCSRDELPIFLKSLGFKVGAEIGVFTGLFTQKFCEAGLTMFAIDPWVGYPGSGRTQQVQSIHNTNYLEAQRRLSFYKDCTIIKKSSMEAVSDFKDESLDFVYIDADHRFKFIAQDLYEWYFKVKKGGIISGHDYFCTPSYARNVVIQVGPVVDAFIKAKNIKNLYVFGKEKYLSWMFFKP